MNTFKLICIGLCFFMICCCKNYPNSEIDLLTISKLSNDYFRTDAELINIGYIPKVRCDIHINDGGKSIKVYQLNDFPDPKDITDRYNYFIIIYYKDGLEHYICIRKINGGYKAFIFKTKYIDLGPDVLSFSPDIIIANVSEKMLKKYHDSHPYYDFWHVGGHEYVQKDYKKIIIDFSKDVLSLEFFDAIEIIE